jgi:hypothetical protein
VYSFQTAGTYSPDLWFSIASSVTAASADRTQTAHEFRWVYGSPKLNFFATTAADAKDLRRLVFSAQEKMADVMIHDLILARRSVRVDGQYFPNRTFVPIAGIPGVVRRVPTESQLINVPEHAFQELPSDPGLSINDPVADQSSITSAATSTSRVTTDNADEGQRQPNATIDLDKDQAAIKEAIANFLEDNDGGDNCWGDIHLSPSVTCTLVRLTYIKIRKIESNKIEAIGKYILEADQEERKFSGKFSVKKEADKYIVLEEKKT